MSNFKNIFINSNLVWVCFELLIRQWHCRFEWQGVWFLQRQWVQVFQMKKIAHRRALFPYVVLPNSTQISLELKGGFKILSHTSKKKHFPQLSFSFKHMPYIKTQDFVIHTILWFMNFKFSYSHRQHFVHLVYFMNTINSRLDLN